MADLSKLIPGAKPHGTGTRGDVTPTPAGTPPAGPQGTGTAQPWREALANEGGLGELVDQILVGPARIVDLTARVQTPCSFHGQLNDSCREQDLGVYDTVEAVAMSPSSCEACEVPQQRLLEGLDNIWRYGWTPLATLWDGGAPAERTPVPTATGVDFVAAWQLDDATAARVAARWPSLTPRYTLAFRSSAPTDVEGALTGFLLLVDPVAERPILAVELLTDPWTAPRAAAYLGEGKWMALYLR